ncbi:MAG: MOP flippase family protein [Hormoscilla sp.]
MSLKKAAASGIKWSMLARIGRQVMQFITTAILANMLAPGDFGLMGMAAIFGGVLDAFNAGMSSAIIQKKDVDDRFISSMLWFNVAFGILGITFFFLCSPLVAWFFEEPRVSSVLRGISFAFLIGTLSIVPEAIIERNLAFNSLAKIEVISLMAGSIVGISSAISGWGVWSLIFQLLGLITVRTVMMWIGAKWRPKLMFSVAEVRGVMSYSLQVTGSQTLRYFQRNVDYLLIAKFLGSQDLGYYTLAYRIMLYPLRNISLVLGRVLFPVLSKVQDDYERLGRAYLKVAGAIALVTFPVLIGLWGTAEPLVLTLFGSKWQPVILLLMILAPVGMEQSVRTTVSTIYKATGRADWMFRWTIVEGILVTVAFAIGLQWGIVGVAIAYSITSVILVYPSFAIPFRIISLPMGELAAVLWRPLGASLLMLGTVLLVKLLLPTSLASAWILGILVLTGCTSYLLANWLINREQMQQIWMALKSK